MDIKLITLRVPLELYKDAEDYAIKHHLTATTLLRSWLCATIEQRTKADKSIQQSIIVDKSYK